MIIGAFYPLTVPVIMLFYAWGLQEESAAPIPGYAATEDWLPRMLGVPFTPMYVAVAYPLLLLVVLGYLAGRMKLVEEPERHCLNLGAR